MLDNTSSPTPQRKTDKLSDISDKKEASMKTIESPVKDIGLFYDKINQMSDAEKFDLLKNVWKPQQDFKFQSKLEMGGKTRKFCYNWLLIYPWLVYSQHLNGCFCLPCLLFGRRTGPNSSKLDNCSGAHYQYGQLQQGGSGTTRRNVQYTRWQC